MKKKIFQGFVAVMALAVSFFAFAAETATTTVPKPSFSIAAGNVMSGTFVKITPPGELDASAGINIFYTLDGTDPVVPGAPDVTQDPPLKKAAKVEGETESPTKYYDPDGNGVEIIGSVGNKIILKAVVALNNQSSTSETDQYFVSEVASVEYTIVEKPDAPGLSVATGSKVTVGSFVNVTKGAADSLFVAVGATLDAATTYEKTIGATKVVEFKNGVAAVCAFTKTGNVVSDTVKATYVVKSDDPIFDPESGASVVAGTKVTIDAGWNADKLYVRYGSANVYQEYVVEDLPGDGLLEVTITKDTTLRAYTMSGTYVSDTITATYTVKTVEVPALTFKTEPGKIVSGGFVKFNIPAGSDIVENPTAPAEGEDPVQYSDYILYTLDGSVPDKNWDVYAGPTSRTKKYNPETGIEITGDPGDEITVKGMYMKAVDGNNYPSAVVTGVFTIDGGLTLVFMDENAGTLENGALISKKTTFMITNTDFDLDLNLVRVFYSFGANTNPKDTTAATTVEYEGGQVSVPATHDVKDTLVVKAVAISDGAWSGVVTAKYTFIENVKATFKVGYTKDLAVWPAKNTTAKNYYETIMVVTETEGYEENVQQIVYTTDTTLTPDLDAYYNDNANGKLKLIEYSSDEEGNRVYPFMVFGQEDVMCVKMKGYIMLGESASDGYIETEVTKAAFELKGMPNPTFITRAGKIAAGDTIKIQNNSTVTPDEGEEGGWEVMKSAKPADPAEPEANSTFMYVSYNGIAPTAYQTEWVDPDGTNENWFDYDGVILDGKGLVLPEGVKAARVKVVAYEGISGFGPATITAGSDVVEALFYTDESVLPKAQPLASLDANWSASNNGAVELSWIAPAAMVNDSLGFFQVDTLLIFRKDMTANGVATKIATLTGFKELPLTYRDATATKGGNYEYEVQVRYTFLKDTSSKVLYDGRPVPGVANAAAAWTEAPKAGVKLTWEYPADLKTGLTSGTYKLESLSIFNTANVANAVAQYNFATTVRTFDTVITDKPGGGKDTTITLKSETTTYMTDPSKLPVQFVDTTVLNGGVYKYHFVLRYAKPERARNEDTYVDIDLRFDAPVINPHGGAVAAGTKATAAKGNFDSIFVAVDTNAFVKYTANAEFTISKATRLVAYGMKNGFVSKYDTVNFTIVVANEAKELAGVRLYPNPTKGEVNVVVPVNAMVEVFAANGMQISRKQMAAGNHTLQINTAGVYFVRVTAADGATGVKRLIVR